MSIIKRIAQLVNPHIATQATPDKLNQIFGCCCRALVCFMKGPFVLQSDLVNPWHPSHKQAKLVVDKYSVMGNLFALFESTNELLSETTSSSSSSSCDDDEELRLILCSTLASLVDGIIAYAEMDVASLADVLLQGARAKIIGLLENPNVTLPLRQSCLAAMTVLVSSDATEPSLSPAQRAALALTGANMSAILHLMQRNIVGLFSTASGVCIDDYSAVCALTVIRDLLCGVVVTTDAERQMYLVWCNTLLHRQNINTISIVIIYFA